MKYPVEKILSYPLLALFVLAVFYGIYFVKMLAQKRRGIRTLQIRQRKEKSIQTVELLMSIATLGVVIAQLVSILFGWSCLPTNARFTGFCTGMLGDLIFLLSVLCMKDSWRAGIPDQEHTELVTSGIYRFSRNPAFLGFDFMYIGVMLMYCNLLTAYGVCHCDATFTNSAGGTVPGRNIRRGVPRIQAAYIPLSWVAMKEKGLLRITSSQYEYCENISRLRYSGGTIYAA